MASLGLLLIAYHVPASKEKISSSDKCVMKMTLLFTLVLSFTTLTHARTLVDACAQVNHIFLLHGLDGTPSSFGSMGAYLEKQSPCYKAYGFAYDTGNDKLTTYDFADDFHEYVEQRVKNGTIGPYDKISMIMHSQGGIIGNIWLENILQKDPQLFSQVDSFITLSTPHWGAEIANIGNRVFFTLLPDRLGARLSPFGKLELNEMSWGSRTIHNMMLSFSTIWSSHLRPLAMGGIHKRNTKLLGEHDTMVPVYSSRADHYFLNQELDVNAEDGRIEQAQFEKTNKMPFVVVKATHFAAFALPGIASIPTSCLDSDCQHPTLGPVTDHLAGRAVASVTPTLREFRVNIYVDNKAGSKISRKEARIKLLDHPHVHVPLLQRMRHFHGKARLNQGVAFTVKGKVKSSGVHIVKLRLELEDKLERVIEVPVEGGFTSLVNFDLNG